MRTRESEEMYLETILLLKKKKGNVRSVDVVEELDDMFELIKKFAACD